MDLTIIIVNWNTKEMLKDCLTSIMQNKPVNYIKVIVVDNSSIDGSREMVQSSFPEVQLINSGKNLGFGKANNLAIPLAYSDTILFLNPDTIVLNNAVQRMTNFMKINPDIGALSCKLRYDSQETKTIGIDNEAHTLGLQWFPSPLTELMTILFLSDRTIQLFKRLLPYQDPNKSGYVSKLYGTALMVRTKVLQQVGCFDERFFMYGEDVDLCRRIMDAGWKLYYLSDAEIVHAVAAASDKAPNNFSILMKCESVSKLMEKYYGKKGRIFYKMIVFMGSNLRLFVLTLISLLSFIFFLEHQKSRYKHSINKNLAMMKWSLNLEKAIIA